MKNIKIFYWVFTTLFTVMILTSTWNYLVNFDETILELNTLGYPSHLIHPLVVAQILGLLILISNKNKFLVEWAYAGFFFNMTFAIIAHFVTAKGNGAAAVFALFLLSISYVLNKRLKNNYETDFSIPVSA